MLFKRISDELSTLIRSENIPVSYKIIYGKKWVLIILLFFLFPPEYFRTFNAIDYFLTAGKLFVSAFVLIGYFAKVKKHFKKRYNWFLFLFWLYLGIITLLSKDASLSTFIKKGSLAIVSCCLIEEMLLYNPIVAIKALYCYFAATTLANTASVILYPTAMYANNTGRWVCWLLGEDNGSYLYYILASTLAILYVHCIKKRYTFLSLLIWASTFYFVFKRDIATGIVSQVVWAVLVVAYNSKWIRRNFKIRYVFILTAIGFIMLVLNRVSIFNNLVTNVLNRSITFSKRTYIWDSTLKHLKGHLLWGHGLYEGEFFGRFINNPGMTHAHNMLLGLLFYVGIIGVTIWAIMIYAACRSGFAQRKSTYFQYIIMGIFILIVRGLMEGNINITIHLCLYLCMLAYTDCFERSIEGMKNSNMRHLRIRIKVRGLTRGWESEKA